jgi:hypothetical protein
MVKELQGPRRRLVTEVWVVEEDSVKGHNTSVTTTRHLEVVAIVDGGKKRYRLNAFGGVHFFEVKHE